MSYVEKQAISEEAAEDILKYLSDLSGIGNELNEADDQTRIEIREAIADIIHTMMDNYVGING
jgi:hypothetical protein